MTEKATGKIANSLAHVVLQFMAKAFTYDKSKREYLKTVDGWMDFSIGLTTEDGNVCQSIRFKNGKGSVKSNIDGVDTLLILQDTSVLVQLATLPPNEVLNLMLKNKMASSGNMAYLEFFNLLISVMMKDKQIKQMNEQKKEREEFGKTMSDVKVSSSPRPRKEFMACDSVDAGVHCLQDDPYLTSYAIEDFPRLQKYLKIHHTGTPQVCTERAGLLTDFFRENGFEKKKDRTPELPQVVQTVQKKAT